MGQRSLRRPERVHHPKNDRIASNQDGNFVLVPRRTFQLIACLVGTLIGVGVGYLIWRPADSETLGKDNSLLVAQELDEVFRKIEQTVLSDPGKLPEYADVLKVFYIYDRKFVTQNQDSDLAATESAYAAQRMGQFALLFGDFEASKSHYQHTRDRLEKLAVKNPDSLLILFHDLIDAQSHIAILEQRSGRSDESKREFHHAVRLINNSLLGNTDETFNWLGPILKDLASLGMELQLCDEALGLAHQFDQKAIEYVRNDPADVSRLQWSEQAKTFLHQITEFCSRRRS